MADRWIKLYEKLEHSSIYHDSELVHLWVHLLVKAQKFKKTFPWNDGEIELMPGQLLTGRKRLTLETGISESKIQRALKRFIRCGMIEQQTTNKYRIITILNWDTYQNSEQQTNSKRTGNEQVTNKERTGNEHIQERKKERKEKEESNLKPDSVSDQTWNDFQIHRRSLKAPITQTVINTFSNEAKKAGLSLESAIIESISRSWRGFKADWYLKDKGNPQDDGSARAKRLEQQAREYIES